MKKKLFTPLLKWLYLLVGVVGVVLVTVSLVERTEWNRERLFQKLVTGDEAEASDAAFDLAWLGGEKQLVRALQSGTPEVRDIASRYLWDLWSKAAGDKAQDGLLAADDLSAAGDTEAAMQTLNALIAEHPAFAEAWHRRAILHWEAGDFDAAFRDASKAVELAPSHLGGWHGLALCRMQAGDMWSAKLAIQKILSIDPHNEAAREMLDECERVIRRRPEKVQAPMTEV